MAYSHEETKRTDTTLIDEIIVGRVEPTIYAFTTETVPGYVKVGETIRGLETRLDEWRKYYPDLAKVFEDSSFIAPESYFRDLAVHRYLETVLDKERLDRSALNEGTYYSNEFFNSVRNTDLETAIAAIRHDHKTNGGRYAFYNVADRSPVDYTYKRGPVWELRPNQLEVVQNFKSAVEQGRHNLLMYAVMRFGKTFTSLCCAREVNAKTVVVVSAKADVKLEWKKAVESAGNFEDFRFLTCASEAQSTLKSGFIPVLFLTLQDLQGSTIKNRHRWLFENQVDLLIIDETHFGARASQYGYALEERELADKTAARIATLTGGEDVDDDAADPDQMVAEVKNLKAKTKLHLSGTPYRILMGDEFESEDVVSFVTFADIVAEQKAWNERYLADEDIQEWQNPYFGFPQMVRFAFSLNESSRARLEELNKAGKGTGLDVLFRTEATSLTDDGSHRQFRYQKEVLDFLEVIDGTKREQDLLSFLDHEKLKEGKMLRHMVMVLPLRAACDAMANLLEGNRQQFKHLGDYKILNISGFDRKADLAEPSDIQTAVAQAEAADQKTITLTVNRMLTGSTVKEWDTMLFLKETASPQEYDQATFRLQNQYTITAEQSGGEIIKLDRKPQTLLVDFDPQRMFVLQEQRSLLNSAKASIQNLDSSDHFQETLQRDLDISPIITANLGKLSLVEPTDILNAVTEYNSDRSLSDEVTEIPLDFSLLDDPEVLATIKRQAPLGSRSGLTLEPFESDEEVDLDITEPTKETAKQSDQKAEPSATNEDDDLTLARKLQTYYQRILFFAVLSGDRCSRLSDIIAVLDSASNQRLAHNLSLDIKILKRVAEIIDPFKRRVLDHKIHNMSRLSEDESLTPLQRAEHAISKFSRISDSEVRTPDWLCADMFDLISDSGLTALMERDELLVDIASKSAEFAICIYRRLVSDLGFTHESVANRICSIPTSPIAYEITRHFYEILNLNVDMVFNTTSTVLFHGAQTGNGIDYNKGAERIREMCRRADKERATVLEDGLRIGAVVGNPPYQERGGGGGTNDAAIYQHFAQIAEALDAEFVSLVIPSRWFSGGRTSQVGGFRQRMLDNDKLSKLVDYPDASEVFSGVDIKGGVCYYLLDSSHEGPPHTILIRGNEVIEKTRPIGAYDILIRHPIAAEIIDSVHTDKPSISEIVSSDTPFGVPSNPKVSKKHPFDVQDSKDQDFDVLLAYNERNKRKKGYVKRSDITKNSNDIDRPKAIYPKAAGSGDDMQVLGKIEVLESPSICSQTYLYSAFDTHTEALRFARYYKTRFFRFLVSVRKITPDAMRRVYDFVPTQDLTDTSDIDWDQTIADIDSQLYRKYRLSKAQIRFIEANIAEMA